MTSSNQPPKLKPPDLWPPVGMSKKEHEATKFLHATVMSLSHFVEAFAAAIELYRFSLSKAPNVSAQTRFQWKWFALHEGAMTIWHLRESLNLVPRRIGPCGTVARLVDRQAMQRAKDLFDKQHFPDFELIRDAIAHAPTISLTMDDIVLNDGLLASPRIKDGDVYEVINRGKRYEFAMTADTLKKVTDVVTTYWAAFDPVVKAFDQVGAGLGLAGGVACWARAELTNSNLGTLPSEVTARGAIFCKISLISGGVDAAAFGGESTLIPAPRQTEKNHERIQYHQQCPHRQIHSFLGSCVHDQRAKQETQNERHPLEAHIKAIGQW